MNMATIATGAVCGVVEAETAASLVALSGNLCSDKKPAAINAVEGARPSVTADVRIPREVVEERLHTTPEAVAELNTRKNLVGSAEGREPRVQRPRRQRRRRDVPRHRAGRGAGRRGRERHHDRRGAGRRPLRLGLHRLPRSRHRRRRHETPDAVRGLDILGVSGGGDPPAPTPTPSPDASPSVPSRANSPFSPRSPRGTSPAPTPNSVGNCMGVVVRPRFIGSEFVDPTLIMNVLSREIPRDYEIPRIQRISRTYYQRLVQSRTCLREGLLCNLRPNRQRLNRLVSFFG